MFLRAIGLSVLQPPHAIMMLAVFGRALASSAVLSGTYGCAKAVKALIPKNRAAVVALRYFAFAFILSVQVVICKVGYAPSDD